MWGDNEPLTDELLTEYRRSFRRDRAKARRERRGGQSREAYLDSLRNKPKPWEAEGISQRQYQRRCRSVRALMSRGARPTILREEVTNLTTSELGEGKRRGIQERAEVKVEEVQENCGSRVEVTNLATCEWDERLAALSKWGNRGVENNSASFAEFDAFMAFPEQLPWTPEVVA